MMIYAAQTKASDSAITVVGNRPIIPIRAFGTQSELRAELDRIWEGGEGDNLIRISRKRVEKWFGRHFSIRADGTVCFEWE